MRNFYYHSKIFVFYFLVFVVLSMGLILIQTDQGFAGPKHIVSTSDFPKVIVRAGFDKDPAPPVLLPENYLENSIQTATININYIGTWDTQAQIALEYAVSIWETLVTSNVPIVVDARWTPLPENVLGSAGAINYFANFTNAPQMDVFYPAALANKLTQMDLSPSTSDISASFNSTFAYWYLGTDVNIPEDQFDFVSVALHELAHGLGFIGSMVVDDTQCGAGNGCWGSYDPSGYPLIYDKFTRDVDRIPLLNFPNYSPQLTALLTSNALVFDGPVANAAHGGQPSRIYAPNPWQAGSSYSHLDQATFYGTSNALMTPMLDHGDVIHLPGAIALGVLQDIGWSIDWPGSPPTPTAMNHCGNIVSNETWFANGVVHVLTCDVTVNSGVILTIEPGAIIKVQHGFRLIINGKLFVEGTSDQPVYFTSYKDDDIGGDTNGDGSSAGSPGDWGWIEFTPSSDDTSVISYAVIRFGGWISNLYYGNVYINDARPTIQHSTIGRSTDNGIFVVSSSMEASHPVITDTEFTSNEEGAISIDAASLLTLDGNTATGNGTNGVNIRGGTVTSSVTWDQNNLPYRLIGTVTVNLGATLTIGPDMIIKGNTSQRLVISGKLLVNGTPGHQVYFTSYKDDDIGGDTNGDGYSAGSPGDWGWIEFTPSSDDTSVISYAVIRFGGWISNLYYGNVYINDASPIIQDSSITSGISGIYANIATPILTCNDIYNNQQYGIRNITPAYQIMAENHWWGSADGPYHSSNPGGDGNAVTDGVDFRPWLTKSCVNKTDLSVSMDVLPDPVVAGETLTYTVLITNTGPNVATNVVMSDTLPSGVDIVSYTIPKGYCADADGTVTCNIAGMLIGETIQAQIVVSVRSSTKDPISNTAIVVGEEYDPVMDNNQATVVTSVETVADLVVGITDAVDPVYPGDNITYTITIMNNGPSDASGVSLVDILPPGLNYVSASGSQGSCTASDGEVACTMGELPATASAMVTLVAKLDVGMQGEVVNSCTVRGNDTDPNTSNNTATERTQILPSADLSISIVDTPDPVVAGEILTYTVLVNNTGPLTATDVMVSDALPSSVDFLSYFITKGSCDETGGIVSCEVSGISISETVRAQVVVTVKSSTKEPFSNTVDVDSAVYDPDTDDNQAAVVTSVETVADLAVEISDTVDPVYPGDNITYTINIMNNGPSDVSGVSLVDYLPAGLGYVSASGSQGSCTVSDNEVTCMLGELPARSRAVVTLVTVLDAGMQGEVVNSCTVSGNDTDPNPANNTATETTQIVNAADLSVSMTEYPDPVTAGTWLTYTINVTNYGPGQATEITLQDDLPNGVVFVSYMASTGSCEESSGIFTCTITTLVPQEMITVTLTLLVNDNVTGSITNTITVQGNEFDTDPGNNSATVSTEVQAALHKIFIPVVLRSK